MLIRAIIKFLGRESCDKLEKFFTDIDIPLLDERPELKCYQYTEDGESVDLHFDTIHGVKGETHAATLYLETFTRLYDIGGKILDFIIADDYGKEKLRKNTACYKKLPHAYVAMTRATHLLAIAVHKDRFQQLHHDYFSDEANGWDLVVL